MRIIKLSALLILIVIIQTGRISAQKPIATKYTQSEFVRAKERFDREKYPAAIELLDRYIRENEGEAESRAAEAELLAALASVRLYNNDAEFRVIKFVNSHPESPDKNLAYLELANSFYQGKNYRKAVTYYAMADRLELDESILPEYYFKAGYSNFMNGDRRRAMLYFSEIMDIDTEYTPPAIYYFSHIAYENEKYLTALDGFKRLQGDESFGSVVPFYIVQIMYIIGDYDGIIELAPSLVADASEDRASELYRIIGDAYFKKGNYSEAVVNLEEHISRAKRTGREGSYQLAYCYYMTGNYDKAIPLFQEVCRRRDELSQNAHYLLGDTYIKTGEKKKAQAAFSAASRMEFDPKIQEDALFNFAKLTYETTYSPFGEVIRAFQEYIEKYPVSDNIDEAYEYLVSAYMQVKNYNSAIISLDRIAVKDTRLEQAYQKVAFYRGMELYKNMNLDRAVEMFDRSLQYGKYDTEIRARSVYWKAEALYRQGEADMALSLYEEFMGIPGATSLDEYRMVSYNIAYVYFNRQEYKDALTWFRDFETKLVGGETRLVADLYNRIADCYYISTDYENAISYYDRVINARAPGADYAMFQKGFARGLMNDQRAKESVLTGLITGFPQSTLIPNALFERGRAYVSLNDTGRGESDFSSIISNHPNSVFVPRAMLQLGLLYFNKGDNNSAIASYKEVIEKFRSTPEARSALTGLRTTYIEMNDVESYFSYVRSLDGYADISSSERDSLLYISGENLFVQGDCERASGLLSDYLKVFEYGSFRLNANFYLAECLVASGRGDEALAHYLEVASVPNNPFLEQTYYSVAGIYFANENFEEAFSYFASLENVAQVPENILRARVGQLRSAYMIGDPVKSLAASARVLSSEGITEEVRREATFISAKSNYALENNDRALEDFRKLATEVTTDEGAESKYRVAEILFERGRLDESEKLVYEFIEQNTPHQYWMARMFILLADISISKNDEFQARATLQGLADYYQLKDDGILDEVRAKLDELNQGTAVKEDTIQLSIQKKNQ